MYPQLDDRFDLGTDNGAWIQEVVDDGPGEDAGLQAGSGEVRFQARPYKPGGDVITKVGDTPIETANDVGLSILRVRARATRSTLEVVRDGEKRTVRVEARRASPRRIDRPVSKPTDR